MAFKHVKVDFWYTSFSDLTTCISLLYRFLKQGYCVLISVLANFANSFQSFNKGAALHTPSSWLTIVYIKKNVGLSIFYDTIYKLDKITFKAA